jgi:DHA2 family multidrug resistance protein
MSDPVRIATTVRRRRGPAASAALLPPYLQNLGGYSVTDAGFLMAPRGIRCDAHHVIASRLTKIIDPLVC